MFSGFAAQYLFSSEWRPAKPLLWRFIHKGVLCLFVLCCSAYIFFNLASVFHVRLQDLILTSRLVTAGCGNFRRGKHTITTNVSLVLGRSKKASDLIETSTNVNYMDFAIA